MIDGVVQYSPCTTYCTIHTILECHIASINESSRKLQYPVPFPPRAYSTLLCTVQCSTVLSECNVMHKPALQG